MREGWGDVIGTCKALLSDRLESGLRGALSQGQNWRTDHVSTYHHVMMALCSLKYNLDRSINIERLQRSTKYIAICCSG